MEHEYHKQKAGDPEVDRGYHLCEHNSYDAVGRASGLLSYKVYTHWLLLSIFVCRRLEWGRGG